MDIGPAHFIQLWHIPDDANRSTQHTCLLQNFVEFLFCGAFESLPEECLRRYFGTANKESGQYSNVGLNVLPPLLQGTVTNRSTKDYYRNLLVKSDDPEIRSWTAKRQRPVTASRSRWREKPTSTVIDDLNESILTTLATKRTPFQDLCVRAGVSLDSGSSLKVLRSAAPSIHFDMGFQNGKHFGLESTAMDPIGNPNGAKIGIIANNAFLDPSTPSTRVPTVLASLGLHVGNCLLWT